MREAKEQFAGNGAWNATVAAYAGLACLEFGDFELAAEHFDRALNSLEEGSLRHVVSEAADRVAQELAQVDAWRSRYVEMIAEPRAALRTQPASERPAGVDATLKNYNGKGELTSAGRTGPHDAG